MPERQESNRSQSNSSRTGAQSSTARLLERGRQVERDAQSFASNLEGLVMDVEALVRSSLEARPYETLTVAAGAGFVLGGGLSIGVLGMVTRAGTKMAAAALLQGTLTRIFSGFQSETAGDRSQS
jgi:ElaB/YqjD/DUF883 family membrane-anchored ribosome-binding protein